MKTIAQFLIEISDLPDFCEVDIENINSCNILGDTPLHIAAQWGDIEMIKQLLDAGAKIDAQGEYGYTPIHLAITQNKEEAAKYLSQRGADLNIATNWGDTAMQLAKKYNIKL